jgi:hypothetical protein
MLEKIVATPEHFGTGCELCKEQTTGLGSIARQANMERQMLRLARGREVSVRERIYGLAK